MLRRICILLAGLALTLSCMSCQKENTSPLVGTSWECVDGLPEIFMFNGNHSGIFYCKSATDDVWDEVFSSFDFIYEVSGEKLTVKIYFSRREDIGDLTIVDDETITWGQIHYKKIQHKVPESTQN